MFSRICFGILCLFAFMFGAVNINTASKEELAGLKGIGAKKAEAIIEYREQKGPFKAIEEIKSVSGIGEKIFESIKNDIVVDEQKAQ